MSPESYCLGCDSRAACLGFGVLYFNTFFLKELLWNKSLYFFLPGYLKAQMFFDPAPVTSGPAVSRGFRFCLTCDNYVLSGSAYLGVSEK